MPFMRPTADKLAKVIPGAQRQVVEGQADDVSSKVLAPILLKFFDQGVDGPTLEATVAIGAARL
ncbi:MAG: hypothetical protein ABI769_13865 [Pseudomonadota bacterium]